MVELPGGRGISGPTMRGGQLLDLLHGPVHRRIGQIGVGIGLGDLGKRCHRIERELALGQCAGQVWQRLELACGTDPCGGCCAADLAPFREPRRHRYGSIPPP